MIGVPSLTKMLPQGELTDQLVRAKGRDVTKKELAKAIAEELDLPAIVAQKAVQHTFDGIVKTLLEEGRIELRNFGIFEVKKRKPRIARNPRTGEKVKVGARLVVTFKPGREMGNQINNLKRCRVEIGPTETTPDWDSAEITLTAISALFYTTTYSRIMG